jgi:tellurite methyltransferase
MSEEVSRAYWDGRHRVERSMGNPEPFVREVLPLLPKSGIALDIGAGRGRHAIALADHGLSVVAVDYSSEAIRALSELAHAHPATIWPLLADLDTFPFEPQSLDVIVNVNFLDRDLFPAFIRALKPGGMLLADTFSIDQAALGHPRNPAFMFGHYELRALLAGLELVRYREGLTVYADDSRAWRASALAIRKETA